MKIVVVDNNQSIWDLAVQHYGSADGVKELMLDNSDVVNFNSNVPAGTELFIRDKVINKSVVDFFEKKGIVPVTGSKEAPVVILGPFSFSFSFSFSVLPTIP